MGGIVGTVHLQRRDHQICFRAPMLSVSVRIHCKIIFLHSVNRHENRCTCDTYSVPTSVLRFLSAAWKPTWTQKTPLSAAFPP